ncbi:MAG TPA: PorV/PorQ family protein [Fibrobacteria bacterium]|nr:PorV/PorQ family protein [Fibrobacteria bacterium]
MSVKHHLGIVLALAAVSGATESSILTLVMPVGARQLGMGETSVGLADDVFAPYWNPAGLAFGPLADEWEVARPASKLDGPVTAMTTTKRTGLFSRGEVWVASGSSLQRFDGKGWHTTQTIPLEEGEKASTVVRRWLGNLWPTDTAGQRAVLETVLRSSGAMREADEKDLVELEASFSVPVRDSILCISSDETGKLWLGTVNGLLRWDGRAWKVWRDSGSGLPSNRITALATFGASVWVGTDKGLVRLKQRENDVEFRRFGESFGLTSQVVTALAVDEKSRTLWVGTDTGGISRLEITEKASTWKQWSTADGLLSDSTRAIGIDPDGDPWVAEPGGVSHWTGKTWEKLSFQGVDVRSVSVDKKRNVWIATDKGVWKYLPLSAQKKDAGGKVDGAPQGKWIHYHSGNGLAANDASLVSAQGEDIWFATPAGIVRAHRASARMGLFYETLLPALQLKDLYHTYAGFTYPVEEWGTFGGFINFLSLGQTTFQETDQSAVQTFSSYELVGALSYGTRLNLDWGFGLNLKFIYSALASGITIGGQKADGVAVSYAFDLSVLRKNLLVKDLSWGAVIQNIGPAVFYISQDEADPIPLTWRTGLAYDVFHTPSHKLTVAADYSRETVSRTASGQARDFATGAYYAVAEPWGEGQAPVGSNWLDIARENLDQSMYNMGVEYTYASLLSLRTGLLFDPGGERQEMDVGAGVLLSDLMTLDYAYIKDVSFIGTQPEGVRSGQSRLSLNVMF